MIFAQLAARGNTSLTVHRWKCSWSSLALESNTLRVHQQREVDSGKNLLCPVPFVWWCIRRSGLCIVVCLSIFCCGFALFSYLHFPYKVAKNGNDALCDALSYPLYSKFQWLLLSSEPSSTMPISAHLLMTLPVIKDDLLSSHVMEGTTYA